MRKRLTPPVVSPTVSDDDEAAAPPPATISIITYERADLQVYLVGESPLVMNPMSAKAKQQLLFPPRKLNRSERETTLKHEPLREFADSIYRLPEDGPTLLAMPGPAFKDAMRSATTDMPGATKAEIGRLVYLPADWVPVWGTPMLHMGVVRSSDIKRTPDIRTRACLPQWATTFVVRFQRPLVTETIVAQLLAAAGEIIGVGDGRPEKGKLTFGRWRLVEQHEWQQAVKSLADKRGQTAAMAKPIPYDAQTEELLEWFLDENQRRQLESRHREPAAVNGRRSRARVAVNGEDKLKPARSRRAAQTDGREGEARG